jgi:alpha-D-ribose 1-methylphosphonate 5-triphosphate synthase subunit PhnL
MPSLSRVDDQSAQNVKKATVSWAFMFLRVIGRPQLEAIRTSVLETETAQAN